MALPVVLPKLNDFLLKKESEIRTCKSGGYIGTSSALEYVRIYTPNTQTQHPCPVYTHYVYFIYSLHTYN